MSLKRLSGMLPSRSKSLSGSSTPRGPALMEGMLEKKKTFGSSKFYCSLQDGKLWYSEDKGRENLIDIAHAQAVREGKARFSFEIITSTRTHTFVADSQSSRDKWITSLREMMRISSRKNSTLSYIESANSDEESGAAATPRSSVASPGTSGVKTLNTPTSPLKPGFAATLPVGFTKRTTAPDSPSLNEETPKPHRTSEMKSTSESALESPTKRKPSSSADEEVSKGHGNWVASTVAAVSHGANKEIKEDSKAVLSREGEKKASVSQNSISEENEPEALSEDDSGEKGRLTINSDVDVAAKDSSVTNKTVTISQSSLYANNADIQKFLNEQNVEPEQVVSPSEVTYANDLDIKKFLHKQTVEDDQMVSVSTSGDTKSQMKGRNTESTSEPELQSPKDTARNKEDTDEESDEVFPRSCNQAEVKDKVSEMKPPVRPVMRRPSQPVTIVSSFTTEVPQPETAAVELDADFCHKPIPDLPHPLLEDSWSSAFTEIRALLSNSSTRKENSALTSVFKEQQGSAVDSLKHFLKSIECG